MTTLNEMRARALELAALLLDYEDHQVVPLPNTWYQPDGFLAGLIAPPPPPPPSGPVLPGFDPVTAVQVSPGQNVATLLDSHPSGTQFRLLPGWHDIRDARPKHLQYVRGDDPLTTLADGSSRTWAFRARAQGQSDGVTIGGLTLQNYANSTGTDRAEYGVIAGKDCNTLGGEWTYKNSKDWTLHDLVLANNATNGIFVGDHFTLVDIHSYGHKITGVHGDRVVGGWWHRLLLEANGYNGAGGAGSNGANAKMVWTNGSSGRTSQTPIDRTKSEFRISSSVFKGTRPGFAYQSNIGAWFDLDNQNVVIEDCVLEDHPATSIFFEGCNGGIARRNTVRRSNGYGKNGLPNGGNYIAAALMAGESTRIHFEDNLVEDCDYAMAQRQSGRSDWNGPPPSWVNYSNPNDARYWLTAGPSTAVPALLEQSNHWSGFNRFARNELVRCNKVVVNEGQNVTNHTVTGSTDPSQVYFEDNDYDESPGVKFYHLSNTSKTLAQWRAMPYQRDN